MGNAERAHKKISPKSGRGLSHVTPKFLAYDQTYLQNYLS